MKIVLYTYDFEPITVIDVNINMINRMMDNNCYRFRVAIPEKLNCVCWEDSKQPLMIENRTVEIQIHELNFFGKKKPIFIVEDRELVKSFEITSTTLPGQRDSLERAFQKGVVTGMSSFISLMRDLGED